MKKISRFLASFATMILLAACSAPKAPTTVRYTLTPTATECNIPAPAIPFARIAVPAYIDTQPIVTRKTDNIVVLNETKIWAEPLTRSIQRTLPILVSQNIQNKKLKTFENVSVFIDRLDGELAGKIKISAQIIVSRLSETAVESESFLFSRDVPVKQAEDPYAAYAQAISTAITELAQSVAEKITE